MVVFGVVGFSGLWLRWLGLVFWWWLIFLCWFGNCVRLRLG